MSTRKSRSKKQAPPPPQAPPTVNSPASVHSASAEEEEITGNQSPRLGRKQSEQKRRILMNQYFDEVVMLLSLISEKAIPKRLDKVSTLKEAVNCMKIYHDLTLSKSEEPMDTLPIKSPASPLKTLPSFSSTSSNLKDISGGEDLQHFLKTGDILNFFLDSYDAFLMVVSETGRILFTTEMVTSLLGHIQSRLVGQNLMDFVHDRDKDTIRGLFTAPKNVKEKSVPDSPVLVYPSVSFTALLQLYVGETSCFPQYLPFKCLSFLRKWKSVAKTVQDLPPSPASQEYEGGPEKTRSESQSFIILIGKLPTSLALLDLAIGTNEVNFEFEMRVSREGRIVDIDKHAILVMGFDITELLGTLFFEYIDPYHITDVGESLGRFLSTGLGSTTPYRIRTKGGRYIWIISKGYLSYNPWNNKPDHILLTNQVLGCDQVLPEHRFFRNRKHLPDLEGRESYFPNLSDHSTPPVEPATPSLPNPPSTRSHMSVESQEQERLQSVCSGQGNRSTQDNTMLLGNVFLGPTVKNENSAQDARCTRSVAQSPGEGAGIATGRELSRLETARRDTPSPSSVAGMSSSYKMSSMASRSVRHDEGLGADVDMVGEATAVAHEMIQRELEEKTQKLEAMHQQLQEKEDKLKHDQMEFYRFMQQMMQRLPTPPNPTSSPSVQLNKDRGSLMEVMGNLQMPGMQFVAGSDQRTRSQGVPGPSSPMMSPGLVSRRGSSAPSGNHLPDSWRGSDVEVSRQYQHQQQDRQSQVESFLQSYPTCTTSSSSVSPSIMQDQSLGQSSSHQYTFTAPNSSNPSPAQNSSSMTMTFSSSDPLYSSSNFPVMHQNSRVGTVSERSNGFAQSPLDFPATPHTPISLADHNMKFYQQQQQQLQQQQEQLIRGWNNDFPPPTSRTAVANQRSGEFSSESTMPQNMIEGDFANLLFSPSLPP